MSNRDKKQKHTDARLEQNTIQNQRHETTCAGISQVHAVWNGSNKICDCATNGRKIFLIMEPQPLTNRATPSSTPASSTRRRQLLLYPFTCTNECNAGDVTEERRPWQSESVSWMSWRGVRRRFARAGLFQAFVAFFKFVKRRVMNRYEESVQYWRERTKYSSPTPLRVFSYSSSWTPFCSVFVRPCRPLIGRFVDVFGGIKRNLRWYQRLSRSYMSDTDKCNLKYI